jgi:hypothetical protein
MQLDGLTQEQVKIVDRLWKMQTNDECTRYLDSLSPRKQEIAMTLMELMIVTAIDEDIVHMQTYPEALYMLRNIGAM